MPTVTVYYDRCPECGQKWSARLSQQNVIRVGREVFVCKCGKGWSTGYTEWSHLSPKKRRDYFISSAEIGVLMICTVVPPLFAYFIEKSWAPVLRATGWGFCVGLAFAAVLWLIKLCIIGLSLRRCPAANQDAPVS
jgi:hypothetical protein